MNIKFEAGINIALKIPSEVYYETVVFYNTWFAFFTYKDLCRSEKLTPCILSRRGSKFLPGLSYGFCFMCKPD